MEMGKIYYYGREWEYFYIILWEWDGMGIWSWEWEEMGSKKSFPHISNIEYTQSTLIIASI